MPAVIPAVIPGGGAVASLTGRRSVSVEGRGALVPTAVLLVGALAVSALVAAAVVVSAAIVGRVGTAAVRAIAGSWGAATVMVCAVRASVGAGIRTAR